MIGCWRPSIQLLGDQYAFRTNPQLVQQSWAPQNCTSEGRTGGGLSAMETFRKSSIQLPVAVLVNALEICAAVLGQGRQTL